MELATTVTVNENLTITTTGGLHDGHTVHVTGTLEAPLFSARDVGVLLGLSNIRSSLMSLPPINKVSQPVETSGGKQMCTYLTEAGFCRIVFKSRAGAAVSIQDALIGALQTMRRDVLTRQPRYVTSGGAEGAQERAYQLYFERVLKDGHMRNRFGETDITTDRAHIELKRWDLYKHALGQLVFYQTSNPRTLSLVCFFGNRPREEETLKGIVETFEKLGIKVFSVTSPSAESLTHHTVSVNILEEHSVPLTTFVTLVS